MGNHHRGERDGDLQRLFHRLMRALYFLAALLLPLSQAVAATYYIDSQRGSDAAAGTSAAVAWQDFETKIEATNTSAGDVFKLACDSTWTYSTSTVGWPAENGAAGNPIIIEPYTPTGIDCIGQQPTLSKYIDTVAGDWTWDAVNGAWYMASGTPLVHGTAVWYGADHTAVAGSHIKKFVSPNTAFSAAYQWSDNTSNSRVYVWTPGSDDNPATYYSGVRVASGPLISCFSTGANEECSYIEWRGIKFKDCGVAIALNTAAAATSRTIGHTVTTDVDGNRSTFENCAAAMHVYGGNATYYNEDTTIDGVNFSDMQIVGVKNSDYSQDTVIRNFAFDGCNIQWSVGGCVYSQGVAGTHANRTLAEDGSCRDARHAVNVDQTSDGSCIYWEQGANGNIARRIEIWDSPVALIDNSGEAGNSFEAIVGDWDVLFVSTDAGALTDATTRLSNISGTCRWHHYSETMNHLGCITIYGSQTGNTVTLKNIALNGVVTGEATRDVMLSLGATALPTISYATNNMTGYRKLAARLTDDATVATYDADTLTADPQFVGGLNPNTTNGFRLKATSPACDAGMWVGSYDYFDDSRMQYPVSIGAMPCSVTRGNVAARANVASRVNNGARTAVEAR